MKTSRAALAAAFAAMGILLAAVVNLLFTPGYLWFYYAAFGLVWWPLAAFFLPRRVVAFSLCGSALTIAFLAALNMQTSPVHPWFLHTVFPLVWWPVSVYFAGRGRAKVLSVVGSVLTTAWLVAENLLFSPGHWWFLYALWPILLWPVVMFSGRRAGTQWFANLLAALTVVYYGALNVLVSPGHPWAIYPAFAVLWWPMSLFFARRKWWLGFSVAGALLVTAFFVTVNLVTSPGYLWLIYPVFAVAWWPMPLFFARHKWWFGFSVAGALWTVAFFTVTNLISSPSVIWAVFPAFAVSWWPLAMYWFRYRRVSM